MQGWVLGARVDDQEVTPFLNSLARRSLTYTQLADETAQGMTSDAEYAALNSQLPLGQGAIAFLRADNHFLTLAHVLQGSGYATLSAHPFKKGFWNRAVIHPRYGFDRSLFAEELGPGRVIGWGLADGDFFTRMVPELAALPRPFFAFLVTLSLHHPYDHFPDDLKQLDLGRLEGSNLGNYLHGMHYLDRSLARLFADLAAADLLEHTVVAIYGDHDSRLPLGPDLLRLAGIAETPVASAALSVQLDRIAGVITLPGGQVRGDVNRGRRTHRPRADLAPLPRGRGTPQLRRTALAARAR
jgi:phosphoglycerol transferase MdoB-like AlkP superfamily enzyme